MLVDDNKNYHAWAHRQWVLEEFNLWDGELVFIDHMLASDLRNNSAWNQRFFVISKTVPDIHSLDVIQTEIDYAFKYIRKAPNNQSPWTYVKGLFKGRKLSSVPSLRATCQEFAKSFPTCAHVISLLVDHYEEDGTKESLLLAEEGCLHLATKLATIHSKYWHYRADLVKERIAKLG